MNKSVSRLLQRYLIPQFITSFYYSVKYRCFVSPQARVQLTEKIRFGRGTVIKPYAILQTWGGTISMGRECAVSSFNHISTGIADIILGDFVRIGPQVTIIGGSRNYKLKDIPILDQGSYHKSILVEDDVLIGAGAVIMPGSQIGRGAVIGALSLVNCDVPPYTIVAGTPARVIGHRE